MTFTEKLDVLELLISIIKEHEEKLDYLISKLEIAINDKPNLPSCFGKQDLYAVDCANCKKEIIEKCFKKTFEKELK